jgi:hypothetical protein
MPKQTTEEWLKGIQRLTGTPGNQSPRVKQIFETPTAQEPHPEDEVPEGTPVVERHVIGERDAKKGNESTEKGGKKASDDNDIQRGRG